MSANATYQVNGNPAGASLQADIDALADSPATHTITLLANTPVTDGLAITNKNITFALAGFNLTISNNAGYGLNLTNSAIDYTGNGNFTVSAASTALRIDGGSCRLTGATTTADGVSAIYGINNASLVTVNGNVSATGDFSRGIMLWNDGTVTVNGNITASGEESRGIRTWGNGATVTVNGNITATGFWSNAIRAGGGDTITVTGNVSGIIDAWGAAEVTINGPVQMSQDYAYIEASDNGTKIAINGNVTFMGTGYIYTDGGGAIAISGNVTANANPSYWSLVEADDPGSEITIGGNLTTSGRGISIWSGATVTVIGNVTANGEYGVYAEDGGEVYIRGTLTANPYIQFYNQITNTPYFVPRTPYPATQTIGGISYHVYANNNVTTLAPAYVYIRNNVTPLNTGTASIPVMSPVGLVLLALALGGIVGWRRRKA